MKPWVCTPAPYKVGVVKQAHTPSTWEMEDNRFKTIFSYKQIQSQTDVDEKRWKVAKHFGYRYLRVLGQKEEISLVLLWSEARNAKGTVALGLVSCYFSSFLVIFLLLQILQLLVRM